MLKKSKDIVLLTVNSWVKLKHVNFLCLMSKKFAQMFLFFDSSLLLLLQFLNFKIFAFKFLHIFVFIV